MKYFFFLLCILEVGIGSSQNLILPVPPPFNDTFIRQWKFADLNQLDVIGNNYDRPDSIGMAPAENGEGPNWWWNNWYPFDGIKHTFCGTLQEVSQNKTTKLTDGYYDDDQHWLVTPASAFDSIWRTRTRASGILGEIDLLDDKGEPYFSVNGLVNKCELVTIDDTVCMHGPFVNDNDHGDNPELHPMEQTWWRVKDPSGNVTYYANFVGDVSERFDDDGDFDTYTFSHGNYSYYGPWAPVPFNGAFAFAFKVPLHHNVRQYFDINLANTPYAAYRAAVPKIDGPRHNLIVEGDTLITVNEPYLMSEVLSVDFERLSMLRPLRKGLNADTLIGFVVARSTLGKIDTVVSNYSLYTILAHGQLFLRIVRKEATVHTYRFQLESIQRLHYNTYDSKSEPENPSLEDKYLAIQLTLPGSNEQKHLSIGLLDTMQTFNLHDKHLYFDIPKVSSEEGTMFKIDLKCYSNDFFNLLLNHSLSVTPEMLKGKTNYEGLLLLSRMVSVSVNRPSKKKENPGGGGNPLPENLMYRTNMFSAKFTVTEINDLANNLDNTK